MDSLLPENGFDVARALVGSEGTLVTVLRAELDLVPVPPYEALLVLGYDDICTAADDVPRLLKRSRPTQLEALDRRMAQSMREEGAYLDSLHQLPEGESWLLVQFTGDSQDEVDGQGAALIQALGRGEDDPTVAFTDDPARTRDAQGPRSRPRRHRTAARWPGDLGGLGELGRGARSPRRLPARPEEAVRRVRLRPSLPVRPLRSRAAYTRIPFELTTAEGVTNFREFLFRAAGSGGLLRQFALRRARRRAGARRAVAAHVGEAVVAAFGQVKALFDPDNRMNPGKVVDPYRVDENLRLGPLWRLDSHDTHFSYPDDDHSFDRAVMRCVGVGELPSREGG